MVRDILVYPNSFLSKSAAPVSKIDDQLREFIGEMFDIMYESNGIGLAATQIGVDKRIIVLDVSPSDESSAPIALINPEIVGCEGSSVAAEEGCLSVPGVQGEVIRSETVIVRGLNENGEPVMLRAGGILGRAIQHEIDHLNGVLFIDRIPPASATEE